VPPGRCAVCEDERQYVGWEGQRWTTLAEMQPQYRNVLEPEEPALTSLVTRPKFAIGQRALLVQSPAGNLLWDCVSFLDEATIQAVRDLGGIARIAISHPHYYSTIVEWSHAFGDVPIYLHAADRQWVMRPSPAIVFWDGETLMLEGGMMLIRCGGHFDGGSVLHWPAGADGRGVLLSGDILQVVPDRRHVSFMYSYPNYIPLAAPAVRKIVLAVEPFSFDRIYGAFPGLVIRQGAKEAVERSAARYLRAITGNDAQQNRRSSDLKSMTQADLLRQSFVAVEVNAAFSEAELTMADGSKLRFCHRVGERKASARAAEETGKETMQAHQILGTMAQFRLNGKHLDIRFQDGSRWELPFAPRADEA